MRVASGVNHAITAAIPGRAPAIYGATEMRFPSPTVTIPPVSVIELSEAAAKAVLAKFGRQGMVLVKIGQSDEDALVSAKGKRAEYLERYINVYREDNARRKASNQEVLMPRERHRAALRELQALRKELIAANPELLDTPITMPETRDVAVDALEIFGLTSQTAPLVPGLTESEALGQL